jgi:C4-dicarboxylate-specific signal transduction histidine kinase
LEYRLRRSDGEDVAIHEQRVPVFDDQGRVAGTVGTIQDITEQVRLAEALREKDLLLLQQSRMAAMGEMISYIAHQWRQPLHLISLLVQNLETAPKPGQAPSGCRTRTIEQVLDLVQHMAATIDDFRDFFRTDKERELFSLEEATRRIVEFVEADLKTHLIEITLDAEDNLLVMGYANEYSHVLLNLLNNAKEALLERNTPAPRVHIRLFREGGTSVITVQDNAGGIPEPIREKLFDAYFTTKETGTGIGLYLSKIIVEKRLQGSISVRNINGGAKFRIEF